MLRITFLGTGGSLPTRNRNPSGIIINIKGELLLFDCGEASQQQMMRAKTGMKALTSIFLTHLHGDHVLGLPGLLQTMSFLGRTEKIFIYGPMGTKDFVDLLMKLSLYQLKFDVDTIELVANDVIKKNGYSIHTILTDHSVPSLGYALIENSRKGRFNREKAIQLGVPPGPYFSKLHNGENITINGKTIFSNDVVGNQRLGRKIVYTGDTRPCQSITDISKKADILIHEATLINDQYLWAIESKHTTSIEAAEVAKEADVDRLILTHISSRYSDDPTIILKEAENIFKNVVVAEDLMQIDVPLK